jgi:hypothetical protein
MIISDIENLLLNMSSGLLPEYLKEKEVAMLVKRFGINWFEELGYDHVNYKHPGECD